MEQQRGLSLLDVVPPTDGKPIAVFESWSAFSFKTEVSSSHFSSGALVCLLFVEVLVLRGLSAGTGLRKYILQSLGLSGLFRVGEKFIVKKGNLVDARTSQGSSLVTKSLKCFTRY